MVNLLTYVDLSLGRLADRLRDLEAGLLRVGRAQEIVDRTSWIGEKPASLPSGLTYAALMAAVAAVKAGVPAEEQAVSQAHAECVKAINAAKHELTLLRQGKGLGA